MPQITDPMDALISFKNALENREISPQLGEVSDDLLVLLDQPNGIARFTYALVKQGEVVAVAIFVQVDPIDGVPCFNSGYAVDKDYRSQGYGTEVTSKAFGELINGFRRAGVPNLCAEAIVSISNEPSKRLANKLFSNSPSECTDEYSGEPALHYVKRLF